MSTTTAPAVLAALTSGLAAVLPPTVQVGNASLFRTLRDDVVCVGFAPDAPAIEASQVVADLMGSGRESYDVRSLASSRRPMAGPDADYTAVQQQVFAIKDAAEDFLFTDPQLGGLVMQASLSEWSYTPGLTDQGIVADLAFTVHIEAFRSEQP